MNSKRFFLAWLLPLLFLPGILAHASAEVGTSSPVRRAKAAASPAPPTPSPRFPSCQPEPFPPYQPAANLGRPSRPNSLRSLAAQHQRYVGAAVDASYFQQPGYTDLLSGEMNLVTPEVAMKWEVIHPAPGRYDFSRGDAILAFAQAHGMVTRGHVLVWSQQLPPWITAGQYSRSEWVQILCQHIQTVVGHYRGQVYAWDVVNEALEADGSLRDTLWLRAIGPEYLPMAFQWAAEADPQARLFYNDFAAEGTQRKADAVYALVHGLQQAGLPIHGVGLQMHVWLWGQPAPDELAANLQRLAGLGLEIHITEMDVRLHAAPGSLGERQAAQAETYRQAMAACLSTPACKAFVTWGLTDRYSWLRSKAAPAEAPLLFDQQGQAKPAYTALIHLLSQVPLTPP